MRSAERDELLNRRTVAAERVADEMECWRRAREAARREREARMAATPLRRLFGDERGMVALLRRIPSFADLWTMQVPARAVSEAHDRDGLRWALVNCECREQVALRPGAIGECPGGCGRFFLHAGRSVRVKRFDAGVAA